MQIIRLEASNIKRLKAVKITPEGRVVKITGRNDQGKSSVIDSIWYALGGTAVIPDDPINGAADKASVFLDLGELKVTRKFTRKEKTFTSTLVVEKADGTRPTSPQNLLNELVGKFTLDPLAFSRLPAKDQFDALKILVPGLDLDAMKKANDADYEKRTVENRRAAEALASAASIQVQDKKIERVDEAPILAKMASAGEINDHINQRAARIAAAEKEVKDLGEAMDRAKDSVKALEAQIELHQIAYKDANERRIGLTEKLAKAPPLEERADTAALAEALVLARAANDIADKQALKAGFEETAGKHKAASEALTMAMEARDQEKAAAIAKAKFPVEGLSLGDEEVLIDGHPFVQAAASKKIKTSVALAMAANPQIRVLRIMDGSLLDSEGMKVISDMAEEKDFQVWIEAVSEGNGAGIVIEDGHIKE